MLPASPIECDITEEMRFAVIMYGGVSLAIYMNGIAQELLHLVRATTPDPNDRTKLLPLAKTSTEAVYRKVARAIHDPKNNPATEPVCVRFLIDIITGTSAGGINGVFLAKALANNESIDKLADLWVKEGGLELLINDKPSTIGTPLDPQRPPRALLNGQRMYFKLLAALDGMDEDAAAAPSPTPALDSPFITDGLDLFVTTTDINGLPMVLRLWDELANERRHKNVFRIKYRRGELNEFRDTNPFLAFASRATSSFPFAFEPITLASIEDLLKLHPVYGLRPDSISADAWVQFFDDYRRTATDQLAIPVDSRTHFKRTPFGDGGYLDNKPFSYAIDVLTERQAGLPVQRKLIYIDPSPEQFRPARERVPNAIENSLAALISLPSYETIREDLERLLARNRLVQRVQRILDGVDDDVNSGAKTVRTLPGNEWRKATVSQLVNEFGASYGGYHRLRVATVTDELATLVTTAAGLDVRSDEYWAVHMLTRAWRKLRFKDSAQPTENEFLYSFDLGYLERRLTFVRSKLDELDCAETDAAAILARIHVTWPDRDVPAFRARLVEYRDLVTQALKRMREQIRALKDPRGPIGTILWQQQVITRPTLKDIIDRPPSEAKREQAASAIAAAQISKLDILANGIATKMEEVGATARPTRPTPGTTAGAMAADSVYDHYFRNFECYDVISLPILHATGVGELSQVNVIRIGPAKPENLAGTKLFHFGAFLQENWRVNDLLWGRLDGARRLIHALLNDVLPTHDRDALVAEAHEIILAEYVDKLQGSSVAGYLANAMAKGSISVIKKAVASQSPQTVQEQTRTVLEACLKPKTMREYFSSSFQLDRSIDPEPALAAIGRSTTVIGEMFAGIADEARRSRTPGVWIARFGQVFWGLVEIAVPGGFWNKVARHWQAIATLCGAILVIVGTAFTLDKVPQAGWITIVTVGVLRVVETLLGYYMTSRTRALRTGLVLIALLAAVLAVIGGISVVDWLIAHTHWRLA